MTLQQADTLLAKAETADEPVVAREDSWLKRTVRLSGLSFLVGDLALVGGGLSHAFNHGHEPTKKELGNALTGLVWATGGIASGLYGNPKKPMQMRIHAHALAEHLAKEGITIPTEVKQNSVLLHDNGVHERMQRFISKHPTEVFNSVIGAASVGMVYSGWSARKSGDKIKANNLWAGLLVMAGAVVGLVIKEDKDARVKASDSNPISKAWAFIKEKPLRLTSSLYLANDYFVFARAKEEHALFTTNGGKKHYLWPLAAGVANIVGNIMLFMSPRNQMKDGFSENQLQQIEELAAETVLAQPAERRSFVADTIANYLSREKITTRPAEHVRQEILARAEHQSATQFGERVRSSQQVSAEIGA